MSVKQKGLIGILGVCLLILTVSCSLLPKEEQNLAPPLIEPSKEEVHLFEVKRDSIMTRISGTAVFESRHPIHHRFENEGQIDMIHVTPGDIVEQGDLLIEKVQPDLELDLLKAELQVEMKREAFEQAVINAESERSIRIAEIELEIKQTELNELKQQQTDAKLTAASAGVVTFVATMKPGDSFTKEDTLVTISDPNEMKLAYQIKSSDPVEQAKVGMEVIIHYDENQYTGYVTQTPLTAPDHNQIANEYANHLYIEMDKYPTDANFGKLTQIEMILDKKENAIVIPTRGLRTYLNRPYVMILDGESRREVDVQVGLETLTSVEIIEGLEEGQQVILR